MDPEIEAMSAVASALEALEADETRTRVLRWAAERYAVSLPLNTRDSAPEPRGDRKNDDPPADTNGGRTPPFREDPVFDDFVDLLDAVDPKSDTDKALTGAYWLQVVQRQPSWQAIRVNNLLKDTGHGISNITTSMTALQSRKPALVRQMAKSGKSQQARKTYKLTTSGVAHVRQKLGLGTAVPASLADHGEEE
jgi:hypothetical protein